MDENIKCINIIPEETSANIQNEPRTTCLNTSLNKKKSADEPDKKTIRRKNASIATLSFGLSCSLAYISILRVLTMPVFQSEWISWPRAYNEIWAFIN